MGPNPMTDTLARREDTAAQKHTGECHVMAKAETGMMTLHAIFLILKETELKTVGELVYYSRTV